MGRQAAALIQQLDTTCHSVDELATATEEVFLTHPDAEIITSFPGLSALSGARVLAEIDDDRSRFADCQGAHGLRRRRTRDSASGRSHVVVARTVKNQRLAGAGYMWAFAALRNLFNKLLGCLFHCLQQQTTYDPSRAFPDPTPPTRAA